MGMLLQLEKIISEGSSKIKCNKNVMKNVYRWFNQKILLGRCIQLIIRIFYFWH